MSASDALQTLTQIHGIQNDNTKKLGAIKVQFEAAKDAVMQHMLSNSLTFVAIGNNEYVSLKDKVSKPSINSDLQAVCYKLHVRDNMKRVCDESEAQDFVKKCADVQEKLSETKQDLVFSKSKPVAALLS
jgi:hypothetical protein